MRSPSVKILPCGRNIILGQDPPLIRLPCDKSILLFQVCNKGRIILFYIKPQKRTKVLCNIKSPKHHNQGNFSSDKLIPNSHACVFKNRKQQAVFKEQEKAA